MTGDCHVRFCERLGGETPPCLLGAFAANNFAFKLPHHTLYPVTSRGNTREPIFIIDTNRVLFLDKKESASIARLKTPLALVVQPVNDPLL